MNRKAVGRSLHDLVAARSRAVFFLTGDVVLLSLSFAAAVWLRYDGQVPAISRGYVPLLILISLLTKIPVLASQRLYSLSWSQVGLEDMVAVARGVVLGTLLFWVVVFGFVERFSTLTRFSRTIFLLDLAISLLAIGAFRVGRRVYLHLRHRAPRSGRPTLIVGAGRAGEQLARSLRHSHVSEYALVGFIDDSPSKIGSIIYGLPVLAGRDRLTEIIHEYEIEAVLIAMPSVPSRVIRNVVSCCREAGVAEIRIVPGLDLILNGQISFTDLREVQLVDLLGRNVVQIENKLIDHWLHDRKVLVTGAGGSIGSELCRQIAKFNPHEIILVDWEETNLFWIAEELTRAGQRTAPMIVNVRNDDAVREAFQRTSPDVVFHAAAYKHVGLMERHPEQAVFTNVVGTSYVARASLETGVERFVLISTDKAVNPTSIMGASKRAAEQICLALNGQGVTKFAAVRFGNVLGSRGSVVPLFQSHIRRGEPITVRGHDMRRYFMATSEAVLLVLQASAMAEGGEVFVLDMGEPVRIVDLAKELIRLSGLEPERDVPIIYADPEPGEKEHEDLLTAEEGTVATRHDRIFVAPGTLVLPAQDVLREAAALADLVRRREHRTMLETLRVLVPGYRPSETVAQRLT